MLHAFPSCFCRVWYEDLMGHPAMIQEGLPWEQGRAGWGDERAGALVTLWATSPPAASPSKPSTAYRIKWLFKPMWIESVTCILTLCFLGDLSDLMMNESSGHQSIKLQSVIYTMKFLAIVPNWKRCLHLETTFVRHSVYTSCFGGCRWTGRYLLSN